MATMPTMVKDGSYFVASFPSMLIAIAFTLMALLVGALVIFKRGKSKKETTTNISTTPAQSTPAALSTSIDAAVDVWEERRQRGIAPASLNHKQGAQSDKPFGSSYYYAHNNPNTTGGYKDGLRMEDYTMNKPRLLAKGGKPVVMTAAATTTTTTVPTTTTTIDTIAASATATQQPAQPQTRRRITITQYLWDDEGSKFGTIIIDKLPGGVRSTDPFVPWQNVPVDRVQATLVDESKGLQVVVYTAQDAYEWDYQLEIRPLFASVVSVETILKTKRLRIKITKKSTSQLFSTYEKWPHAHMKKT